MTSPKAKPINYRYNRLLEELNRGIEDARRGNTGEGLVRIERVAESLRDIEFVESAKPL